MEWKEITSKIREVTGQPFVAVRTHPVGGGCINNAVVLEGSSARYFVKHNAASRLDMFTAEAEGLEALHRAGQLRVPKVICFGLAAGSSFLVLEHLEIRPLDAMCQRRAGASLANLHAVTGTRHGWHRDNTLGSTPQPNGYRHSWSLFFRDQRLGFQLQLARDDGHSDVAAKGEQLLGVLDGFFDGYPCRPSLLHGDLWSGNVAGTETGEPVVYDPAVYFGDRETDVAMTELFGGFSDDFYASYNDTWRLDAGYSVRRWLYQLYHLLNHLHLFGRSYAGQCKDIIDRLLAEARG